MSNPNRFVFQSITSSSDVFMSFYFAFNSFVASSASLARFLISFFAVNLVFIFSNALKPLGLNFCYLRF